jgi:hypothetical protein
VAQASPPHPAAGLTGPADSSRDAADRLRAVQAEVARARASLDAARQEEAAVLAELHAAGRTWFKIASYVPVGERKREAQRLRSLVHRHRPVTGRHAIRRAHTDGHGEPLPHESPSVCSTDVKENSTMTNPRLIKRTVTTEEIFDDRACLFSQVDDDEDDAVDEDDDDEAEQTAPPRVARGKSQDSASMSGTETAGTDDPDLNGEED